MRKIKSFNLFENTDMNRVQNFLDSLKDPRDSSASDSSATSSLRSTLIQHYKDKINRSRSSQDNLDNNIARAIDLQQTSSPVKGVVNVGRVGSGAKKQNAKLVIDALNKYGIVNPITQKAILSVIGKESNFIPKDEISYKNTSNERIRKIFGSRVSSLSDDELNKLKKDDVAFWDKVYGGRYGNDRPGDGSKYRGRGFNGLTFKANYEKYNKLLRQNGTNVNIVANPEMANDPKIAAEINALYFVNGLNSKHSKRKFGNDDPNDFTDFDKALGAAVNANAGWGKNISGSRAYRKALAYSRNFDVDDFSNLA